jgi:tetratricopeptide (TPR) repeat protein
MDCFKLAKSSAFFLLLLLLSSSQQGICVPFPSVDFSVQKNKPIDRRTPSRRKIEITEPVPIQKTEEQIDVADPELRSFLKAAESALREADPDRAQKIFSAAASRFPRDLRPSLGVARCYFIKCEYDKAIKCMAAMKARYPLAAEPYAMLGNIYMSLGAFEQAKKNLDIATQLEHGDSQAYFQLAQLNIIFDNYDEAINQLKEALRANSNNKAARVLLSQLFWSKGKIEQALQETNGALSEDAEDPFLLRQQAMLLFASGRVHDSIEKLHEAYRNDPENAEIQKLLLTIYGSRRDWPNAYDAALSWAQMEPENAMARATKGWCALRNQEFDEALSCLKEAVKLAPNNAEIHNLYGLALIERRKFDDALAQFSAAQSANPQYLPASLNKAEALYLKGRFTEALSELSKLELNYPDNLNVLNMHTHIYCKTGNFVQAEALNKQALNIDAHDPFALICQGIIYREQGKLAESAAVLLRASKLATDSATPLYELSATLLKQGKGKQAIEMAQQALQIAPSNLEAKANLAFALAYEKNFDGPISLLKECIVRNPKELNLRIALADIEQAKGEFEDSRITLGKAHTLFPDSPAPLVGLAKIESSSRNYKRAIDLLEEAQVCAPQDSSISLLIARNYYSLGKPSACLNQLSPLEDEQLSADDLHMKANCEYSLKDFDEAADDYSRLEKKNSLLMGSTDLLNFARSLLATGQASKANDVLSRLEADSSLAKQVKQAELDRLRGELKHALAKNGKSMPSQAGPR